MRTLAIGDIHGCVMALRSLLDSVSPVADDTVVTLGDYVDRGPDARGVIDELLGLRHRCRHVALRGNHELMMLDARDSQSWLEPWLRYGGEATLRSYATTTGERGSFADIPDAHFDFLQTGLQSFYETDSHFFVHAYADADQPIGQQSEANLYWRKYKQPLRHTSGKVMVCGHTPQSSGVPRDDITSICIDTKIYDHGWLTCLDVAAGKVWQANEAGITREFALADSERFAQN